MEIRNLFSRCLRIKYGSLSTKVIINPEEKIVEWFEGAHDRLYHAMDSLFAVN